MMLTRPDSSMQHHTTMIRPSLCHGVSRKYVVHSLWAPAPKLCPAAFDLARALIIVALPNIVANMCTRKPQTLWYPPTKTQSASWLLISNGMHHINWWTLNPRSLERWFLFYACIVAARISRTSTYHLDWFVVAQDCNSAFLSICLFCNHEATIKFLDPSCMKSPRVYQNMLMMPAICHYKDTKCVHHIDECAWVCCESTECCELQDRLCKSEHSAFPCFLSSLFSWRTLWPRLPDQQSLESYSEERAVDWVSTQCRTALGHQHICSNRHAFYLHTTVIWSKLTSPKCTAESVTANKSNSI